MTPTKTMWLVAAIMAAAPLAACNMVSGAEGLSIGNDDDDDGDGGGATSSGVTSGSTMTTAGVGGAGVGGTGTTVAATGVGGMGTASTTGAGAGPTSCDYPAGPYGVGPGQIVPPNLSWNGFAPGESIASTFTAEDLFDCDGSRGIHAVVVDTSQYG